MAELRKINRFIDLIRKNRVNENQDFRNFAVRLFKLLPFATNENPTQTIRRIVELFKRVINLPVKYAFIPLVRLNAIQFNPHQGAVLDGYTRMFSKIVEFNLPGSGISLGGTTPIYNCVGIRVKVSLPLKLKLFFELSMQKPVHKRLRRNKHKSSFLKKENKIVQPKPIFKPEEVQTIFDSLKNFFSEEQQPIFYQILKTGNDISEPLLFFDYGNRLADAFKQLINAGIIMGCEKKELENWIFKNFRYRNNQNFKDFSPRYLNDIISSNNDECSNPILNVVRDKVTGKFLIKRA